MKTKSLKILGLMSGTSLDGLDMALCEIYEKNHQLKFELLCAETIIYNADWKQKLQRAINLSANDYFQLNSNYGKFIGDSVNHFLKKNNQTVDYIASHGHTVFHQPQNGFTTQIGCGATIAATCRIDTICDFRSLDVAYKGQGAPLVPIGDRDLFPETEACLNIGGIANISFTKQNNSTAFDICYANILLNYLCESIGKPFDENGEMSKNGKINIELLQNLCSINTNKLSLGRELFEDKFKPLLDNNNICINDKLATCIEYTSLKITDILHSENIHSVLITGGGAYNSFLVDQLQQKYKGEMHLPEKLIIEFKEAIIFAYLGYLRVNNQVNTLQTVTGAIINSIGGCIYKGSNI